ncbi:MAG: UvrD-helicase domain-containing protein [Bacteroidia bacterium]|nr:UvrD-helicase domain-containing protein [Bacteroidia bacterium]
MDYLSLLNPSQRAAVENTKGPVMIVAGAGSGKTRVLTYRVAHILKEGVDAFNILSLTFTNKASKEMRERIHSVVGSEARNLWMGTFHSIFARILRVESERIGYPRNFTIYDTDDAKSLLKTIIKELGQDDKLYKPAGVLGRISAAKNALVNAGEYMANDENTSFDESSGRPMFGKIFQMYQDRCFKASAMDFDDLLLKTFELFKNHPDVLHKYQHQFKYIMVDEFQDTNQAQYAIIKKLAAVHQNIAVVGDDAQSIYAFRGATIANILGFQRDFSDTQVFKLEQNYRSSQTIVEAAGGLIKLNKDQIPKKVFTTNDVGEKIKVLRALTDNEEGRMVASSIFQEKMNSHVANKDFAILYRTNAQSRSLEEALRKMNIPYRIYGGLSFYHRKEIKDIIAYLRLVLNTNDEEALKRVINYPARGIGKTTMDKVMIVASENNISLFETLERAREFQIKGYEVLGDFVLMIRSFQTMLKKPAYDVAMHVAKQTGLLKALYEDKTVEGIARYENIEELLNGLKEFSVDDSVDEDGVQKYGILEEYMADIALLTDSDKEDPTDNDRVTMMTIHASKGLEFKNVFIVGLEENLFPSQLSLNSRQELEEERRLFYVAITRAMNKLTLSFATSRFKFGNITNAEPSRFLSELDPKFLQFDAIFSKGNSNVESRPTMQTSRFGKPLSPTTKTPPSTVGQRFNTPTKPAAAPPPAVDPNFVGDDTKNIQLNQRVEHQRFGFGNVVSLDGVGDNRKAEIEFEQFGKKMIVLKFAKLKLM